MIEFDRKYTALKELFGSNFDPNSQEMHQDDYWVNHRKKMNYDEYILFTTKRFMNHRKSDPKLLTLLQEEISNLLKYGVVNQEKWDYIYKKEIPNNPFPSTVREARRFLCELLLATYDLMEGRDVIEKVAPKRRWWKFRY